MKIVFFVGVLVGIALVLFGMGIWLVIDDWRRRPSMVDDSGESMG